MISVIICTYNRYHLLEDTIRSFLACQADGIDHELLIVDNNSTDGTRVLAERYAREDSRIRYLFEPMQGLSHARNSAIRESQGEIVAFVDDDVYFSPCWLKALVSSFERHHDAACIGGKVVPHFDGGRPAWVDDHHCWIYGVTRYGEHEREILPPEIPIGCNMAFRRAIFEKIGGFHTGLGRKGGNLISNEDNHFLLRAVNAGLKIFYSPDALVSHRIPNDRTTRQWVLRRYYWQGASDVALRQILENPLSRVKLTKKTIKTLLSLLLLSGETAMLLRASNGWSGSNAFNKRLDICYKLGTLRQMIIMSLKIPNATRTPTTACPLRGEK